MLGSFLIGAFLAIHPLTSLPIPPVAPQDYLEAHLSPWTDEVAAKDPYTYPEPVSSLSTTSIVSLIQTTFGKEAKTAIKIATCESNLVATATLASQIEDSRGVFQINTFAHRDADPVKLYEPEYNIQYAKALYDKEGFYPWSCFKSNFIPNPSS